MLIQTTSGLHEVASQTLLSGVRAQEHFFPIALVE